MFKKKYSFLDRLTNVINTQEDDKIAEHDESDKEIEDEHWLEEEAQEGQLTVDVYQTPDEIVLQTMVAGSKPDDLDVSITREMVIIRGKRQRSREVSEDDYLFKELYWGSFSRTIVLPQEIDVEGSEAVENNGLLTIRLPKIDKKKSQKIKVKTR